MAVLDPGELSDEHRRICIPDMPRSFSFQPSGLIIGAGFRNESLEELHRLLTPFVKHLQDEGGIDQIGPGLLRNIGIKARPIGYSSRLATHSAAKD